MTEEVNESVEEVVASQPTETEEQANAPVEAQEKKASNDVEYNWAEARRKMRDLERQNADMQKQLQSLSKPAPVEEEFDNFADDDILTAAQAKKLAKKMAMEVAQEAIRQKDASTVDERLALKHPDFSQVVTRDNVEKLMEIEPELASSLRYISDPYQQGITAYKMLKKLGIHQEDTFVKEREKAKMNSQKPVSVNAVTKNSAIGNAHLFENGLTADLKKQLYEEMRQCAKRA